MMLLVFITYTLSGLCNTVPIKLILNDYKINKNRTINNRKINYDQFYSYKNQSNSHVIHFGLIIKNILLKQIIEIK